MARSSRLPLAFAAFVGAGLLLESQAGRPGELALGVLTWFARLALSLGNAPLGAALGYVAFDCLALRIARPSAS